MSSARMTRWAIMLAAYKYNLYHKNGTEIAQADFASRFPLEKCSEVPLPPEIKLIKSEDALIDFHKIKELSKKDSIIQSVLRFTKFGWTETNIPETVKPYYNVKEEFSC
jgi:hypothetical protein